MEAFDLFLSNFGTDGAAGDELRVSVGPNLARLVSTERLHKIISKLSSTEHTHLPFSITSHFGYSDFDANAKSDFNKKTPNNSNSH